MNKKPLPQYDVVVVGSGVAGILTALKLPANIQVLLISKDKLDVSSSYMAQGGIAAKLSASDSFEQHIADTMRCGVGLCNLEVVSEIVHSGPNAIAGLQKLGVQFTEEEGKLHLTQEGGHRCRRVAHAGDFTGREVSSTLLQQLKSRLNITVIDCFLAIDLITDIDARQQRKKCIGIYLYDCLERKAYAVASKQIVLATGGCSKMYYYSSNPETSIGDGIAMAWRAGCRVANLEFQQFHPTCLYVEDDRRLLLSEAMRGEGAYLHLPNGTKFMQNYHQLADLAPRDVVARAIDSEMKKNGLKHVFLNLAHKDELTIKKSFPTLWQKCLQFGFDMCSEPLPVVPAAHYCCGGVYANIDGSTDLQNLYAVGEVACTFMHGANRLASNSLLECIVIADNLARQIEQTNAKITLSEAIRPWQNNTIQGSDAKVHISHLWEQLRHTMWDYVGIERSSKRLRKAQQLLANYKLEINAYYVHCELETKLIELRNLVTVADLVVDCALRRKESRGLHHTKDYPKQLEVLSNTVLVPRNFSGVASSLGDGYQ